MRPRSFFPRLAVAAVVPAVLSLAFVQSARAQSADTNVETPDGPAVEPVVDPAVNAALTDGDTTRVLVVYADIDPVDAAAAVENTLDGSGSSVTLQYTTMPVVGATIDDAGLDALTSDPSVVAVFADEAFGTADVPSPRSAVISGGYGRDAAGGATAPASARGAGWWVAVIDSGVNLSHPYLAGKGGAGVDGLGDRGACFSSGSSLGDGQGGCPGGGETASGPVSATPCTWQASSCGHGTHVAGIATGSAAGIIGLGAGDGAAPGAGVYPVQVFSPATGGGSIVWMSDLISGLEHVESQRTHYRFAAVNVSIVDFKPQAGYCEANHPMRQVIARLAAAGVPVVAAAGNEGTSNGVDSPACIPEAVAVSAADMTTAPTVIAGFSNAHRDVTDLVAGGNKVLSSEPGGHFAYRSGTSMATPAVAGAMATLRQVAPSLDGYGVAELLTATAQPVADPRSGATYKRINLAAAVAAAPSFTPTPKPTATPPTAPAPTPPSGAPAPSFPAGAAGFNPIAPVRIADSRTGTGIAHRLAADDQAVVAVAPAAIGSAQPIMAIAGNVTATDAAAAGYLTVWPCDQSRPASSSVNFTPWSTDANAVAVGASAAGTVCVYSSAPVDVIIDVTGVFQGDGGGYQPVVPLRVMDTRHRSSRVDATPFAIQMAAVPNTASAVTVNVTAVQPQGDGFVTMWPCGQPMPATSSLNFVAGRDRPNLVTVGIGAGASICAAASVATDLVVDLQGWFEVDSSLRFSPLPPARVADSRSGVGLSRLDAGATQPVVLEGLLEGASVAVNVTVTNPASDGYLTVWPCGQVKPLASNVNYAAGQTIPNAVVSGVGAGGRICVSSYADTDVVIDLAGAWTA